MYKVTIGLEVHCELETNSKNFSSAKNTFTEHPNINVSAVDVAFPGTLPVVNKEAVRKALKTALALNCTPPEKLVFDRKHYFYPDLPKGYQITQLAKPVGINGYLDIKVNGMMRRIDIHQIHLEEDTASLEHFNKFSLLDYNRAGIPLIEVVTEPCLHNADEAIAFLETLRSLFLYCEVSEADSKKGQMRCDVNISLAPEGSTELGVKVEMKNINAFTKVRNAIEYEIKRQSKLLSAGKEVLQETRRFSDEDGKSYAMRSKADAIDYKYFPEPNMPPIKLEESYLDEIRASVPMLQGARFQKYVNEYGLSEYDADVLSKERSISDYYEAVVNEGCEPKPAANWVSTVVLGSLNKLDLSLDEFYVTATMLADVVKLVESDKLSRNHAKKILYRSIADKVCPIEIIKEEGLEQTSDEGLILEKVKEAIDENPDQTKQYLEGKDWVANYFIGQVMNKTNKQANPKVALKIIKEELDRRKK